jgi:hypothetical protein
VAVHADHEVAARILQHARFANRRIKPTRRAEEL